MDEGGGEDGGGGGRSGGDGASEEGVVSVRQVTPTPTHRLILGVLVLVTVDVIWVASSELSEHIFHAENFDKPFFSTYVKTSMFLVFLVGFLVWPPWHERCFRRRTHRYTLLTAGDENINTAQEDLIEDNNVEDALQDTLSPSFYVPVNYDPSSGNESSDEAGVQTNKVKFSKLAEVRQMSEKEASDAIFSRMSYQASIQAEELAYRFANRLSPSETARLALTFCIMWFIANYTYQLGLSHTEAGVVNVLSSSSSLFTLLLAAIFPSIAADKFTLSKLVCVLVSLSGVAVVSLTDLRMENKPVPVGAIFSLISAFFYASYLVFLRKKADHEDKLDIPMFFGFVGLFNLLILWPLFFVLNYAGVETFEWPTRRQWMFLVINGFIGTVFSEVLWLWGCFLTSSLIATLAISLTIPMSMAADVLLKGVSYSKIFYFGSLPMLFSFFAVTLLSHFENWDPLLDCFTKVCSKFNPNRGYRRVLVNPPGTGNDQHESLLGGEDDREGSPTLLLTGDEE